MRRDFWSTLGMILALYALGFIVGHLTGCKPSQLGATAAESAYTGELLRCVDNANTLAESRACRADVDLRWGIVSVGKDGGH